MPSGKTKEDTWKSSELEKELKDAKDDRKKRDKDRERDKKRDKHKDDVNEDKRKSKRRDDEKEDRHKDRDREKRHRDRENGDSEKRDKHRDKDRDRDKHRSNDDDRKRDDKDRKKRKDEDNDDRERRHRRHRDDDDDRERRHRRHMEENGEDRHSKHRRHRDEDDEERERRRRRNTRHEEEEDRDHNHDVADMNTTERKRRDEEYYKDMFSSGKGADNDNRERRHRRHREDNDDGERRRHRRHRDYDSDEGDKKRKDDRKKYDDDRKQRRHRDDDERKKHRDRDDDDRKKRRDKDDDEKRKRRDRDDDDRRKHRDKDDDKRKHRDGDDDRKHKRRDDEDEEERRRRKKEEKRRKEKEEEERRKREEEEKLRSQAQNTTLDVPKITDPAVSPETVYEYSDDFESVTSSSASCHADCTPSPGENPAQDPQTREMNHEHDKPEVGGTTSNTLPLPWSGHEFAAYMDEEEMDSLMQELRTAEENLENYQEGEPETMVSHIGDVQGDLDAMFGEYKPIPSPKGEAITRVLETNSPADLKIESIESVDIIEVDRPKDSAVRRSRKSLVKIESSKQVNDAGDQENNPVINILDVAAKNLVENVLQASIHEVKTPDTAQKLKSKFQSTEPSNVSSGSSVSVQIELSKTISDKGPIVKLNQTGPPGGKQERLVSAKRRKSCTTVQSDTELAGRALSAISKASSGSTSAGNVAASSSSSSTVDTASFPTYEGMSCSDEEAQQEHRIIVETKGNSTTANREQKSLNTIGHNKSAKSIDNKRQIKQCVSNRPFGKAKRPYSPQSIKTKTVNASPHTNDPNKRTLQKRTGNIGSRSRALPEKRQPSKPNTMAVHSSPTRQTPTRNPAHRIPPHNPAPQKASPSAQRPVKSFNLSHPRTNQNTKPSSSKCPKPQLSQCRRIATKPGVGSNIKASMKQQSPRGTLEKGSGPTSQLSPGRPSKSKSPYAKETSTRNNVAKSDNSPSRQNQTPREISKKQEAEAEEDAGDNYDYDDDFEDYDDDFEDEDDDDGDSDDDNDRKPARKKRGKQVKLAATAAAKNGSDDEADDEEDDDDPYNLSLNSAEQIQSFHSPGYYKSYETDWLEDPDKFNSEMDEIMQAMNDENDRLLAESNKGNWSDSIEEDRDKYSRPKTAGNRTFINFTSAKQRTVSSKVTSKARRRGLELEQIIELDVASYDLFDMPPVKEYDMYIRSFGSSNTKQAYIQTNEDNIDRDIQTEEIETRTKWTQNPPDDIAGCGGEGEDENMKKEEREMDSVKLARFLESAGQVMAVLLEEDFADRVQSDLSRKQSNICVSDAYVELAPIPLLAGRCVVASRFSPIQTHMLLLAYSQSEGDDPNARKGALCVWNVNEPSQPHKLLLCESQPRCCCFSPMKSTLAFAGMSDGSLAVWDLRESSSVHKIYHDGKEDRCLRFPTYNTAGVLHYENHSSAIVAICPIVSQGEGSSDSMSGESGESLSFQLATLEENSQLHLWVVAEINTPDLAGSESDLGLSPGGRIKLIKSSAIVLESPLRDQRFRTTMKCFDMQLLPSNNSHYYVTTDVGCLIHGVRYGGKAPPKAYRTELDALIEVTSVDFSPFTEPVFLAGFADGSLRLYHVDGEQPLISWPSATEGRPIKMVRFCRSRPSVFFVLDTQSNMYIWDLNMDDAVPLKSERISSSRVTSFCLSNDHSATGIGLAGRRPQMVVCLDSGAVEVHTISKEFSALMAEEVDQFAMFLQKIL